MSELNCQDCKGECCDGSMFDSVIVYKSEIKRLRALGAKIARRIPFSTMEMDVKGGCMFLKNGRCSIYKKRPISCGTYDCRPEEERYDDEDHDHDEEEGEKSS